MTIVSWILPPITAHLDAPKRKKRPYRGHGQEPRPIKWNAAQMIADRIAGMTWDEVAAKHGVRATAGMNRATYCCTRVMGSKACFAIRPQDIVKVFPIASR